MEAEIKSAMDALDTIGNIAAWVRDNCGDATNQTQKYMDDIIMFVNAALALPRLNCEVGSPEEQNKRFTEFCASHYRGLKDGKIESGPCDCPCWDKEQVCNCFVWAQMPYEAEGGTK
jgi:hypothetical protein